jgi:hypothetical protein
LAASLGHGTSPVPALEMVNRSRRNLTAATYRATEPDDQLVAIVRATAARTPWGGLPSELFQPWLTYFPQRPVRLVLTRHRLLCQRRTGKVLFNVPLAEVGMSVFRAKNTDAIWFNSPSVSGPDWRFIVPRSERPALYALLSAAQDYGAHVTPIVRPAE